jgi:hypothetical protein
MVIGELPAADPRTGPYMVPSAFIAGLLFIATALVLLGATLVTLDRPTVAVVWASVALAAYLAGLMCIMGLRYDGLGMSQWKIGPWMLLWYCVEFGLVTVIWSGPQYGPPAEIALPNILRALWLVASGMTAWAIGYWTGPGRWAADRAGGIIASLGRRLGPDVRSPAAPWILYGIGSAARLATVGATGRFGYLGNTAVGGSNYTEFLSAISLCAPLAVAAASLQVFREGVRSARKTLLILFIAEALVGAASGGKGSFVTAVLAVVIPYSTARRRLPGKNKILAALVLLVLVVFFLVVLIPFNLAYRATVRTSLTLTPSEGVAAAPGVLRDAVLRQNPVTLMSGSLSYLAQRVSEIGNPAIILQRTPAQVPFLSPAQLVKVPLEGFVPRAVWPGKPILATGLTFSKEFFELPPATTSSSADTLVGGLYWYGGWLPLLTGMFLVGCGVRLLDGALDARANSHAIFLILLLLPAVAGVEDDWNSLLAGIPAMTFTWLLALFLTFQRRAVLGPEG